MILVSSLNYGRRKMGLSSGKVLAGGLIFPI
jgi:hypothetical protein